MPKGFRLDWNGAEVQRKVEARAVKAIDRKLSEAVVYAKSNHRGWNNRTGTAEGSVKVQEWARRKGNLIIGSWGSRGVNYVLSLEFYRGSFLRNAAKAVYGRGKRIF